MLKTFQAWLMDLPFSNPLRREQAVLLQAVLLIVTGAALIGSLSALTAISAIDRLLGASSSLLLALVLVWALILLRRGSFMYALLATVVSLLAMSLINMIPTGLEGSRAIFTLLAIPIVLTGFVNSGRALALVFALSTAVVIGVTTLEILAPGLAGYSEQTYDPLLTCLTFIIAAGVLTLLVSRFGAALQTALRLSHQQEQALTIARDQAESANKAKTTFLMTMSHELRTPLNAIVGYSEMLLEQAEEDQQLAYQADLNEIRTAGLRLTGIIQDILDMANIESGGLALTPQQFFVDDLLAELEGAFQPLAAARGNSFVLDSQLKRATTTTDREHLRQVLWKLLDNANKFTDHGAIKLNALLEQHGDRPWLRIEVEDSGVGIPASRLAHVFIPFSQGDMSATRRYDGSGLGLAICHAICRLMAGDLTVESQEQRGSTFCIRIPLHG
jgi:signal transduction histidine kinase